MNNITWRQWPNMTAEDEAIRKSLHGSLQDENGDEAAADYRSMRSMRAASDLDIRPADMIEELLP